MSRRDLKLEAFGCDLCKQELPVENFTRALMKDGARTREMSVELWGFGGQKWEGWMELEIGTRVGVFRFHLCRNCSGRLDALRAIVESVVLEIDP